MAWTESKFKSDFKIRNSEHYLESKIDCYKYHCLTSSKFSQVNIYDISFISAKTYFFNNILGGNEFKINYLHYLQIFSRTNAPKTVICFVFNSSNIDFCILSASY